jgi:uncharacterized protein YjbI with pentapeptide repeats
MEEKDKLAQEQSAEEPLVRYQMMAILMDETPIPEEVFALIRAQHREFIASGGGGGHWETFVTSGGTETGIVLGVYVGQQNQEATGAQAQLSHKRLEGLDLRGLELPYADLCGVSCRAQDLSGANLAGSLVTDSDFEGSSLRGANLAGADFSRANLRGCDLREADLTRTDLENADLTGADLRDAKLNKTRLHGVLMPGVLQ